MRKTLSIIIPTFNNPEYLNPCISSILRTGILDTIGELIIINNGEQDIQRLCGHIKNIKIIKPEGNLGWEGGLKLGLENSDAPFVVFQNDDTFIPPNQPLFYRHLLSRFSDDLVGVVSPSTTIAAGPQSIYSANAPAVPMEVPYLIFFTVMVRRSALDEIGGVDTTLPGGDDIDVSMRMRKAGYKLLIDPGAFLIHHAFKTGERVNGGANVKGGWNSEDMRDRTNAALIRKHGFKYFVQTLQSQYNYVFDMIPDLEGDYIRSHVNGHKDIVELGCGPQKTIKESVGMDRVNKGETIPHLNNDQKSVADIIGDVTEKIPLDDSSQDLIIARHILEHCVDIAKTMSEWKRILRTGGEIIIAVPDERVNRGIPLNPEHVHAFTKESLKSFMQMFDLEEIKSEQIKNNTSFVSIFRKVK
jgi:glycosyltransferase involved in cell wall biosynthesis